MPANNDCHANATCTDLDPKTEGGTFSCACNTGYSGNGTSCTQVACPADAEDWPNCTCLSGMSGSYTWTGTSWSGSCSDINECSSSSTNNCSANATCTNQNPATDGSPYSCACNEGYSGNGTSCSNINECATGADNCGANSACTDKDLANDGVKFLCSCLSGYEGDPVAGCTNIDDCLGVDCGGGTCVDELNSYSCVCDSGYSSGVGDFVEVSDQSYQPDDNDLFLYPYSTYSYTQNIFHEEELQGSMTVKSLSVKVTESSSRVHKNTQIYLKDIGATRSIQAAMPTNSIRLQATHVFSGDITFNTTGYQRLFSILSLSTMVPVLYPWL